MIIIGAGIAGLSAAHLLTGAGLGVRVLEAEPGWAGGSPPTRWTGSGSTVSARCSAPPGPS
ncbi:FAD-dependent oxidoreductase [Streptomyces sp. S063]|uniref:FAD-dependent oxidoreductase n=1 Tax=Streptomyces sp. S063 TaxID=2005885 RepID=UPI003FCCBF9D